MIVSALRNGMDIKVSVLIPVHNGATTIRTTLESVLQQTRPPDEIIAMDDGSTDETARILKSYESRITILSQANSGVSAARNALVAKSCGDLIAFIDSDDIWHPEYLETHVKLFERFPKAAAIFLEHLNFGGLGKFDWNTKPIEPISENGITIELLEPLVFVRRFGKAPGPFVLSFCCLPRRVFTGIGPEPFRLREAEDVYFCNLLPFYGPIVYSAAPVLAAYRVREGSLASNRLTCTQAEVTAFELLASRYEKTANPRLLSEFYKTFASKRRGFAKVLLGIGNTSDARRQLLASLLDTCSVWSLVKSVALLLISYLPELLQPAWPPAVRNWKPEDQASVRELHC